MNTLSNARIPVLGFAALSGTGKTTLLAAIIPLLTAGGIRVGLVKHAHHEFEVDKPGKDSFILRKAGATSVMLSSSHRRAIITEHPEPFEPTLNHELSLLDQSSLDVLLVEGFKHEAFPKIELHRHALVHPLLFPGDPNIIAIAADAPIDPPPRIVSLNLNDPVEIAEFIVNRFLPHVG